MNRSLLIGLLTLVLLSACTTQKRRSDQSMLSRLYHNTTAHYNGYFNAEELRKKSILILEEAHEDNYNKLLDLFPYAVAENPQAVAPDLDKAIEKVTVVVNLHRQSNWTDDCYLLVGQAQYLKQDYEAAEKTFRYLVNEYSPEKMAQREKVSKSDKKVKRKKKSRKAKKRKRNKKSKDKMSKAKQRALKKYNKAVRKARKKGGAAPEKPAILLADGEAEKKKAEAQKEEAKKDKKAQADAEEKAPEENPENYFLKHRPVYQEGLRWLAQSLIERAKYDQAMRYIRQLDQDPGTFPDVRADLMAVEAYYYLSQKEYDKAVLPLERALEMKSERPEKARYAYILGQLHQRAGRLAKANEAFDQVLKYGPEYEMEFSAKLNQAQNAYLATGGNPDQARAALEKMLKDSKNLEFQDKIYFALAQIDLEQGNRTEAIANLEKSLRYSAGNRSQRAEAYYTLADLYFETENFIKAKNYFDSTLQVLPNTDERYARVENLSENLSEIAANLEVIVLNDSLLAISKLSEAEKLELASQIKRERDKQRLEALKAKQQGPQDRRTSPGARFTAPNLGRASAGGRTALQQESTFFAYDDKAVKRGRRDFEKQWGDRTLEDNWRRSSESSGSDFEDEAIYDEDEVIALTDEEVNKLLGDVPTTEQEIAAANLKIQEAMFNLGSLYRSRLDNNRKSVDILEQLNERYPGNTFELDSWYLLYLAHTELGETNKAREYADKIIEKYSSSTYAMVLRDPNYAETLMNEERRLNRYYDEAYGDFTSGRYQQAYQKSLAAKEKFGAGNPYQAKFALLSAMCTGNLEGKEAYVAALTEVVARYPDTPEQTRAKEIMRLLGGAKAVLPGKAEEEDAPEFKVEDDQLHYIIIAFEKGANLNDQKNVISNFNLKYHKLDKLRISNIFLGTDPKTSAPLVVIRRFKNKEESMKYYNGVQQNVGDFIDPEKVSYQIYPVTQNNYRQILREKSLAGYNAFFQLNYLN